MYALELFDLIEHDAQMSLTDPTQQPCIGHLGGPSSPATYRTSMQGRILTLSSSSWDCSGGEGMRFSLSLAALSLCRSILRSMSRTSWLNTPSSSFRYPYLRVTQALQAFRVYYLSVGLQKLAVDF